MSASVIRRIDPCNNLGDIPGRIPANLKDGFNALLRSEPLILKYLDSSPDAAARFLANPGAVLAELKVPVDSNLAAVLSGFAKSNQARGLLTPRSFCLPNGQQITPNIKFSFVAHKDSSASSSSSSSSASASTSSTDNTDTTGSGTGSSSTVH